eukprot:GEMP01094778.1.p2 GENE.GEMP01094778.1~~GEMP01094778.1.p2  ORF type:complete len:102 (+),score=20.24 GEMP01094778.1:175-480(+)
MKPILKVSGQPPGRWVLRPVSPKLSSASLTFPVPRRGPVGSQFFSTGDFDPADLFSPASLAMRVTQRKSDALGQQRKEVVPRPCGSAPSACRRSFVNPGPT